MKGTLYLFPNTLGGDSIESVLPGMHGKTISGIRHFIVESEKSAKALLKKFAYPHNFIEAEFFLLNEHTDKAAIPSFIVPLKEGKDMGLISDAGCPGIADPGADVVKLAHQHGIKVIPLTGPSSIVLSLMGSGFNGQSFTFHGYLPYEKDKKLKKIQEMERLVNSGITQIFIEAPYRNRALLEDLCKTCNDETSLCLACDLTLPSEYLKTKKIKEWKRETPEIHKRPCIFLLGR